MTDILLKQISCDIESHKERAIKLVSTNRKSPPLSRLFGQENSFSTKMGGYMYFIYFLLIVEVKVNGKIERPRGVSISSE